MIEKVYQTILPEPLRRRLWIARRDLNKWGHDMRWKLMGEKSRRAWADERLRDNDAYWMFVLGCNNSGTTLLAKLLEEHPGVRYLPKEGQRMTEAIPNCAKLGVGRTFSQRMDVFRWTEEDDASMVPRLRYDWAALYTPGTGVLFEKSPPNMLRSRWLQKNFQPSRFIGIVRHPYAVCEGVRRRRNNTIEEAAVHWNLVHEILEQDEPYLEHYWMFQYEQLCQSPLDVLQEIEHRFDLEPYFTEEHTRKNFAVHNCDDAAATIHNFNAKSFARLSPEDVELINAKTETQMRRMGYEPMDPAEFGPGNRWADAIEQTQTTKV